MSWVAEVIEGAQEIITDSVKTVLDRLIPDPNERKIIETELVKALAKHNEIVVEALESEIKAKEKIILAEMKQGDKYTSRARPTILYSGLAFFFLLIVPGLFGRPVNLTPEIAELVKWFFSIWGGIAGVYVIGRSAEKAGATGRLFEMLRRVGTGREEPSILS